MIGCINKQSMSFVMLIIRNSSNRPLHLHFFLDDSSGQGRGLFFIIFFIFTWFGAFTGHFLLQTKVV